MIKAQAFAHSRKNARPFIQESDISILEVKNEKVSASDYKLIHEALVFWLENRFESILDEWFTVCLTMQKDEDGNLHYVEFTEPEYPLSENKLSIQVITHYINPVFGETTTNAKTFNDLFASQVYFDAELKRANQFTGVFIKILIDKTDIK